MAGQEQFVSILDLEILWYPRRCNVVTVSRSHARSGHHPQGGDARRRQNVVRGFLVFCPTKVRHLALLANPLLRCEIATIARRVTRAAFIYSVAELPPFYFRSGRQTTMTITCQRLRRGMLSVCQRPKARCFARKTICPTW